MGTTTSRIEIQVPRRMFRTRRDITCSGVALPRAKSRGEVRAGAVF
jgi:hypothetical protein